MLIIDRFEGEFAVCEDDSREMHNIPRSALPAEVREGDVLRQGTDGWQIDAAETAARREKQAERLRRLFGK